MSTRIIAQEIRQIVALVNDAIKAEGRPAAEAMDLYISPPDVQHFITGVSGSGTIQFTVPGDYCAVIVAIEEFNADQTLTRTTTRSQSGEVITTVQVSDWTIGADLFYVFPTGSAAINLVATPQGGKTYRARAIGYILPYRIYSRLARMGTQVLSN